MRKIATFVLLTLSCFLGVRCSDQSDTLTLTDDAGKKISVSYTGVEEKDKLLLTLTITDNDGNPVLDRKDVLDISNGFRLKVNEQLLAIAKSLTKEVDEQELDPIISGIENIIRDFASNHKVEEMGKEEVQGLFYYQSVFKTIKRYYSDRKNNKFASLSCTTYEGYIAGLSPYHAKEDVFLKRDDIIRYLSGDQKKVSKLGARAIIDLMNSEQKENLSVLEFETKVSLMVEDKSRLLRTAILEGGDCGCCGNYNFVCVMSNVVCMVHDMACQTCTPEWFCLRGCRPTPC